MDDPLKFIDSSKVKQKKLVKIGKFNNGGLKTILSRRPTTMGIFSRSSETGELMLLKFRVTKMIENTKKGFDVECKDGDTITNEILGGPS